MKKRFENVQVDDVVRCPMIGDGKVAIKTDTSINVFFPGGVGVISFDIDGNPLKLSRLLYVNKDGESTDTRPVNWNDVKPGTICFAWDDGQQSPPNRVKFRFVADGKPWFEMTETILRTFKHAEVVCDV